jgi:hypothetical protein
MNTILVVLTALVVGIALFVVIGMVLALPVMWLWNGCLVGAVGGVAAIDWLQAWGLLILFGLLFSPSSVKK